MPACVGGWGWVRASAGAGQGHGQGRGQPLVLPARTASRRQLNSTHTPSRLPCRTQLASPPLPCPPPPPSPLLPALTLLPSPPFCLPCLPLQWRWTAPRTSWCTQACATACTTRSSTSPRRSWRVSRERSMQKPVQKGRDVVRWGEMGCIRHPPEGAGEWETGWQVGRPGRHQQREQLPAGLPTASGTATPHHPTPPTDTALLRLPSCLPALPRPCRPEQRAEGAAGLPGAGALPALCRLWLLHLFVLPEGVPRPPGGRALLPAVCAAVHAARCARCLPAAFWVCGCCSGADRTLPIGCLLLPSKRNANSPNHRFCTCLQGLPRTTSGLVDASVIGTDPLFHSAGTVV